MSAFTDILKSGAASISGAVSEKLGIEPAQTQGLIDNMLPADQTEPVATDALQDDASAPAEAAPQAEGLMGKVSGMLDQDGDGNPLNDIANMAGKFFNKS
jgi:ABC-type xylose transport system substrate-binding protein